MKKLFFTLLLSTLVRAETPPASSVTVKGGTDGTKIGNVGDALKTTVSFPGSVSVTQGTSPWVISGNTGRTWSLLNSTDSVNVGNFPSVFGATQSGSWSVGRTWTLLNSTDSVNVGNFPATQAVTQSTSPWVVSGTVSAGQSGTWTVQPGNTANTTPWLTSISEGGNLAVVTASNALKVDGSAATQPISGSVSVSNFPATQAVTQSTSPWVVSGTVTSNIGTTNGLALDSTLSTFSAKFNTLGQKTMANSAPVVIASDQSAVPVSGTVTANAGTGNFTVVQTTGSNLHVAVDSAPTTAVTQSTSPWVDNISQFGGSNVVTGVGNSGSGIPRVTVSSDSSITNISGTVSLPTGAATAAKQPALGTAGTPSADVITVQGASAMTPIKTSAPVNTTGSGSSAGATVSTVATITAPSNAVGFILMNLDTSTTNMRWAVGRTASTTLGQQLQPGRDSGFVPVGANISIIAESGTCNYDVQWVSQ